jgi:hypothetical protein
MIKNFTISKITILNSYIIQIQYVMINEAFCTSGECAYLKIKRPNYKYFFVRMQLSI